MLWSVNVHNKTVRLHRAQARIKTAFREKEKSTKQGDE